MRLNYDGKRYILHAGKHDKALALKYGFKYNPKTKTWSTLDVLKAYRLKKYADEETLWHISAELEVRKDRYEASFAKDSLAHIEDPPNLTYYPFQRAGIEYALKLKDTIIGDEMGLGKTVQAIGVINCTKAMNNKPFTIQRVLIVCPASLKLNWKNELNKWLIPKLSIGIITAGKENIDDFSKDIVIINYELLKKYYNFIQLQKFDLLIVDECHYLKNFKAQRTQYVLGNAKNGIKPIPAEKRLFLTGTPMMNCPADLYTILSSISPEWGSWLDYAKRYCAPRPVHMKMYGRVVVKTVYDGADNTEELQKRLRSTCMIRRRKDEVLTELPAKIRQVIELPANSEASKLIEKEKAVLNFSQFWLNRVTKHIQNTIKEANDTELYKESLQEIKNDISYAFEDMAEARKETALHKVPQVVDYIKNMQEYNEKVVIFAHHHEVIDALKEKLEEYGVVKLDGRDSIEARQKAINDFQSDKANIFIGGIRAAGVGITLTAAHHVVFAELDWVPSVVTQAEDRCHRIGQEYPVNVIHLVLENSIDANMANAILRKQKMIDKVLDQKESSDDLDYILELITELME